MTQFPVVSLFSLYGRERMSAAAAGPARKMTVILYVPVIRCGDARRQESLVKKI